MLLALAVAAACATGAHAAGLKVLWLKSANHTSSARGIHSVDRIVIHVTEGSFWGSVSWLRNRRSHGSSHYVISRGGDVVQLVSTSNVAWHAGNRWVNRHSIGIEHEGFTRRGGYTDAQYRASARLVAYLAAKAGMPVDRRHVIGHAEVPNPRGPGVGGVDHHTDPGRHWNWERYLGLVRLYSKNPVQPTYSKRIPKVAPLPRSARPAGSARTAVLPGAAVRGISHWWSGIDAGKRWRRGVYKVDFLVDGERLWTDNVWPFAFARGRGWDTRTVANGRHMLSLRIYGRGGYRARKQIPVRVVNPPLALAVTGALENGAVRGELVLEVRPSQQVARVALYADGKPVSRDASPPYSLRWDTTDQAEGPHELLVYARAANGRRAAETLPVVVANASDAPASLWGPPVDHAEPLTP
ncbi:MAG TPA: N-acetylmuramoyl-L-alanine amidase [Gaiellaceae bacterium]|nr:N-acetylmuramoyl-L-alanine amidase [Gaiellaceae bacterium]